MKWVTKTDGTLTVTFNVEDYFFQKIPAIVQINDTAATAWVDAAYIYIYDELVGTYLFDEAQSAIVDVSEWLAMMRQSIANVKVSTITSGTHSVSFDVKTLGYQLPPAALLPPPTTLCTNDAGACILPTPSVVWQCPTAADTKMEIFSDKIPLKIGSETMYKSGWRSVALDTLPLVYSIDGATYTTRAARQECGKQYARVRWVPPFGGEACVHGFELRDVVRNVNESTALMPLYNEVSELTGFEFSGTMHFDSLNAYDYWYYSLIALSQDVRVIFDETETDFGDWSKVQISTKKVQQPNGNGRYTLDIDFTFAQYAQF